MPKKQSKKKTPTRARNPLSGEQWAYLGVGAALLGAATYALVSARKRERADNPRGGRARRGRRRALLAAGIPVAAHCYVEPTVAWHQNDLPAVPGSWILQADYPSAWFTDPCAASCDPGYYIYVQRYRRQPGGVEHSRVYCAPQGTTPQPPWDPDVFVDPSSPPDPPFPAPGTRGLSY